MTTTNQHRWAISAIDSTTEHGGGAAATVTDAWIAALAAGRAALLAGHLDTLAVAIDGEVEAMLDPGRDAGGRLEAAAVTATLVEMHQGATAHLITDLIVGGERSS